MYISLYEFLIFCLKKSPTLKPTNNTHYKCGRNNFLCFFFINELHFIHIKCYSKQKKMDFHYLRVNVQGIENVWRFLEIHFGAVLWFSFFKKLFPKWSSFTNLCAAINILKSEKWISFYGSFSFGSWCRDEKLWQAKFGSLLTLLSTLFHLNWQWWQRATAS